MEAVGVFAQHRLDPFDGMSTFGCVDDTGGYGVERRVGGKRHLASSPLGSSTNTTEMLRLANAGRPVNRMVETGKQTTRQTKRAGRYGSSEISVTVRRQGAVDRRHIAQRGSL